MMLNLDESMTDWVEKYGDGFVRSLRAAAEVRAERRKSYGDTYRNDYLMFLYYQMNNKIKRFKSQIAFDGNSEYVKDVSVAVDSLLDLICYAAFAFENTMAKELNDDVR